MALNTVSLPFGYYPDPTQGRPVFNGSIFIGEPDLDPTILANQKTITIRQEGVDTPSVPQPIRTSAGGVPVFNGSPAEILVDGSYSMAVLNNQDSQVYYVASQNDADSFSDTDLRYGPVFATVAAMTAANPVSLDGVTVDLVVDMLVSIEDYATGNNSGIMFGRVVAAATGTADGGSFIDLANGLQFKQNFPAIRSVKLFGAKGDGATDDSSPIQATVDSFPGAGTTLLPVATYLVVTAIDLDNATGVTMEGASYLVWSSIPHGAVLKAGTIGMNMIDFSPAGGRTEARNTVVDLYLDGDSKAEDLIRFDNFSVANFTRVMMLNSTRYGMNLGDTNASFGAEIDTCYFNGNPTSGIRNNSRNTQMRYCRADAQALCVDIQALGGQASIDSCFFESGTTAVVNITSAGNCRITGTFIAAPSVATVGVDINGVGAINNVIDGCIIQGNGAAGSVGVKLATTDNIVSNTQISSVENGVELRSNSNVVDGNVIDATQFAVVETAPGGANSVTDNEIAGGTLVILNDETIVRDCKGASDQEATQNITLPAGNSNDFALNSLAVKTLWVTTNAATSTITGITGGVRGRRIRIANKSVAVLNLTFADAASAAGNRLVIPGGATRVLVQHDAVDLEYNDTTSEWYVIG
jgi:hypothetical protein